jgi:hypothetical protein
MEKRNSWNVMSSAFKKDFYPTEEEIKDISSFVFCRFLSNHPFGALIVNFINVYPEVPIENQYQLVRYSMPKIQYLKYPSTKKIAKTEELENVMEYYNCSEKTALEYLELMSDEEKERIMKKFEFHKMEKRKNRKK